ncbi:MAG: lipid-A-disaccharide synthase [Bacteroidota bacterium]|nr:lipid-A-disaccharide synthase [Bacteroidota bacterium]
MKYYIIAGEASGDLHGSNLILALKEVDPEAEFRVWGGDKMEAASRNLVMHYRKHAFMGLFPVLWNLRTIWKNFKIVEKDLYNYRPDALVLIDYSGFNLRVAKKVKNPGLKIYYYISPQVWAWRKSRVNVIKSVVDKLFSILPFEKEFYKQFNFDVEYVGHPLLDAIQEFNSGNQLSKEEFFNLHKLSGKPIIALLPGSRIQEIKVQLPIMAMMSAKFKDYEFVIAAAPSIKEEMYEPYLQKYKLKLVRNHTYELLKFSEAALVTSGTATLEAALLKVPQVVCYKAGTVSYVIVKHLVNVSYISIVNLIMDDSVIKELIQKEMNPENIEKELNLLLNDRSYRSNMIHKYEELEKKLGGAGASKRAAKGMFSDLTGKKA